MERTTRNPSTPTKAGNQSRSGGLTPRSPATKIITNRAIYKSPRRSKPVQYLPDDDSDISTDSVMSEKSLLIALSRQSWKAHLRSSDFHPAIEQADASDDSLIETKRKKAQKEKTSKLSEPIQLDPQTPPKKRAPSPPEPEKPETPIKNRPRRRSRRDVSEMESIQADINRTLMESSLNDSPKKKPSKDSMLAFQKAGPVRHSDSEESEPDLRRRRPRRSTRQTGNDTLFNTILLDLSVDSSNNTAATESDRDSIPCLKRTKPKKSMRMSDSINLDLKLDQTQSPQHSSDSSDTDEVFETRRKRQKPKKSTFDSFEPVRLSITSTASEKHVDSVASTDEEVFPTKRQKLSKRKTIAQLDIPNLDLSSEKENTEDEEKDEFPKRRRPAGSTRRTAGPIEINFSPFTTPEKRGSNKISTPESEEDSPQVRPSRQRKTRSRMPAEDPIVPLLDTPDKRASAEQSATTSDDEPPDVPTRSRRSKSLRDAVDPQVDLNLMSPETSTLPKKPSLDDDDEEAPPSRPKKTVQKKSKAPEIDIPKISPEKAGDDILSESEEDELPARSRRVKSSAKSLSPQKIQLQEENPPVGLRERSFHKHNSPRVSFQVPQHKDTSLHKPALEVSNNVSHVSAQLNESNQELHLSALAEPVLEKSMDRNKSLQSNSALSPVREDQSHMEISSDDSPPDTRNRRTQQKSSRKEIEVLMSPIVSPAKKLSLKVTDESGSEEDFETQRTKSSRRKSSERTENYVPALDSPAKNTRRSALTSKATATAVASVKKTGQQKDGETAPATEVQEDSSDDEVPDLRRNKAKSRKSSKPDLTVESTLDLNLSSFTSPEKGAQIDEPERTKQPAEDLELSKRAEASVEKSTQPKESETAPSLEVQDDSSEDEMPDLKRHRTRSRKSSKPDSTAMSALDLNLSLSSPEKSSRNGEDLEKSKQADISTDEHSSLNTSRTRRSKFFMKDVEISTPPTSPAKKSAVPSAANQIDLNRVGNKVKKSVAANTLEAILDSPTKSSRSSIDKSSQASDSDEEIVDTRRKKKPTKKSSIGSLNFSLNSTAPRESLTNEIDSPTTSRRSRGPIAANVEFSPSQETDSQQKSKVTEVAKVVPQETSGSGKTTPMIQEISEPPADSQEDNNDMDLTMGEAIIAKNKEESILRSSLKSPEKQKTSNRVSFATKPTFEDSSTSRKSKSLQEVQEILNYSKMRASKGKSNDVANTSNASIESIPNLQRKNQRALRSTINSTFELDLMSPEKEQVEAQPLSVPTATSKEKVSQGSGKSSQTTHVSESPAEDSNKSLDLHYKTHNETENMELAKTRYSQRSITDSLETSGRPSVRLSVTPEAERSGKQGTPKIAASDRRQTTAFERPKSTIAAAARARARSVTVRKEEDEASDADSPSDEEIVDTRRQKSKKSAQSTLDEDLVGELDFERDSSNSSTIDPQSILSDSSKLNSLHAKSNRESASTLVEEASRLEQNRHANEESDESLPEKDSPVDFKRRRAPSKKSADADASAIMNLTLSLVDDEPEEPKKSIGQNLQLFKEPPLKKPKESKSIAKQAPILPRDSTADADGISMTLDDLFTRHSMFKQSTDEGIDSSLSSLKSQKQLQNQLASSGSNVAIRGSPAAFPEGQDVLVEPSKSSMASKALSKKSIMKTHDYDAAPKKNTQESIKRNLTFNGSSSDDENEEPPRKSNALESISKRAASTPLNDVTFTVTDVVTAVQFLENNPNEEEALLDKDEPEEQRIFTADDFRSFVEEHKGSASFSKKKFFTLTDLGKALTRVRSPSIAPHQLQDPNEPKKYSYRDFKRAMITIKTRLDGGNSRPSSLSGSMSSFLVHRDTQAVERAKTVEALVEKETRELQTIEEFVDEPDPEPHIQEEIEEAQSQTKSTGDNEESQSQTIVSEDSQSHTRTMEVDETQEEEDEDNDSDQDSDKDKDSDESEAVESDSEMRLQIQQESSSSSSDDDVSDKEGSRSSQHDVSEKEVSQATLPDTLDKEEAQDETLGNSQPIDANVTIVHDEAPEETPVRDQDNMIDDGEEEDLLSVVEKQKEAAQAHATTKRSLITSYFTPAAGTSSQSARRTLLRAESPPSPQARRGLDESGITEIDHRTKFRNFLANWKGFVDKASAIAEAAKKEEAERENKRAMKLKAEEREKAKALREAKKKAKAKTSGKPLPVRPSIIKELKLGWVNQRLLLRIKNSFKDDPPRVMNDFLRSLSEHVEKVVKSKKVPDASVRKVMKMCHRSGVCPTENGFYKFAHEYLPGSFTRLAYHDTPIDKVYYNYE